MLVLITCPTPRAPLEPYYVAMLKPSAGKPSRFFTLERTIEGGMFFCEFRASGGHAILKETETASRSEFTDAIERELKRLPAV